MNLIGTYVQLVPSHSTYIAVGEEERGEEGERRGGREERRGEGEGREKGEGRDIHY